MATYPISTQQSEIDSYIDMCNARPELARPTAQLPDGTLIAFAEVTVAEDTVTGKADADGRSYALTLSRTPGASQVTEAAGEMVFDTDKSWHVITPEDEILSFVERFERAREQGRIILPYLRFYDNSFWYIVQMQFTETGSTSTLEFFHLMRPDTKVEFPVIMLNIRKNSPGDSVIAHSSVIVQKQTDMTLDTTIKTVAGAINELAARTKVEAVDTLPESPDANTLYVTPASE